MYIDTHLDTLWQTNRNNRDFGTISEDGHVDVPRARKAGLFLGFFTGFPTESQYATERMLARWVQFMGDPKHQIRRVANLDELNDHLNHFSTTPETERHIGAVLHFEGAAGIDTELNRLYIYHDLGLRSMGLTWNEQNQFATGVSGDEKRGLSTEGKNLIDAMRNIGIILDVSHLNDRSFWDVQKYADTPFIASHSNLRMFADHPRNLTNEMVQAIGESGGSIGINFCKDFLSVDQEEHPANRFCAMRMAEAVIDQIGIDHVHIGSDFDGCTVPDDIRDMSTIPQWLDELREKLSLTTTDIDKIAHGNMLRIIRQVWR